MTHNFLQHHNIPIPSHIDDWVELDHVRILRFKGNVTSSTLPKILEFKMEIKNRGQTGVCPRYCQSIRQTSGELLLTSSA